MYLNTEHGSSHTRLLTCLAALLIVPALAVGCGSDGGDESEVNTTTDAETTGNDKGGGGGGDCQKKPPSMPAKHACWHVCAETPIEVDATTSGSDAPTVQFGKTYTVSLNDDGNGTYSGTVRFDAAEEEREAIADGETKKIHFHTVRDVTMSATATGSSNDLSVAGSNEYQCDQGLEYSKVFEMEAQSYDVTLGPIDREQVTLVVVPLNGPAFKKK
jgi:hypothetical protein